MKKLCISKEVVWPSLAVFKLGGVFNVFPISTDISNQKLHRSNNSTVRDILYKLWLLLSAVKIGYFLYRLVEKLFGHDQSDNHVASIILIVQVTSLYTVAAVWNVRIFTSNIDATIL